MGVWGAGIYQDDYALDLKNAISLVCKIPGNGAQLLDIIREMQNGEGIAEEDECTFWLVVADQFERRGITCSEAFANALSIIDNGRDLQLNEELGFDERSLRKRKASLHELAERLRNPRPVRPRTQAKKPPGFVVEVGEVYAFPTMGGKAFNAWFSTWEQDNFDPDGWGALVILQAGRGFDWLPWVSVASLTVTHEVCPTLEGALQARLLKTLGTRGAAKCVPKQSHIKRMHMQLLGSVSLNVEKTAKEVSALSTNEVLSSGRSLCSAAFSTNIGRMPLGPRLADLVEESANSLSP